MREYVKHSLYDRVSTRPFLTVLEKKWITFQILCALNQCHKQKICHGDIKLENILITSWNWILLSDFASFKPTYLPEDNPADYTYFFDTSRRRTCYIAPERFVKTLASDDDGGNGNMSVIHSDSIIRLAPSYAGNTLLPAMDIFSAGYYISLVQIENFFKNNDISGAPCLNCGRKVRLLLSSPSCWPTGGVNGIWWRNISPESKTIGCATCWHP